MWPLTPPKGSGERGNILTPLMLIYRHWAIMAYSEKWSDIIDLDKCEDYYAKKQKTI